MKPTPEQLHMAVIRLSMLRYFPGDEATRAVVMDELSELCGTPAELKWLVDTMVRQVGEWKGPKELRGVFCSRFKPADGHETTATETVGFRPADLEQRSYEQHERLKAGFALEPGELSTEISALAKGKAIG